MAYVNLPGTFPKLIDGNLRFFTANNDPVVLVIGTGTSGFTSQLYTVSNVQEAIAEFGATSEIAKGLIEARDGGARNLAVLRLPGTAPILARVGAEEITNGTDAIGFTITPVLESDEAGSKYGVAYRHSKSTGTAGAAADATEVVSELMIVDLEDEEVVYHYDAANGVIIDQGLFDVDVDDVDGGLGTAGNTEKLVVTFANAATASGTITVPISGVDVTVAVTDTDSAHDVAEAFIEAFNAAGLNGIATAVVPADPSGVVTITANKNTNSDGNLVYPTVHPWAGYTARLFFSGPTVITDVTGTTVTTELGTDHPRAMDIGLFPQDTDTVFSVGGGVFVPLEDVFAGASYTDTDVDDYEWPGLTLIASSTGNTYDLHSDATFTAGDNGTSISLMKRYEKLNDVMSVLDFQNFDYVLPQGVILDAPNVVDSDVTAVDLEEYPTPGGLTDYLGKLYVVENDDYTFTYVWDTDNDGEGNITNDSDLDPTTITGPFYEVNFAHQLAKFCYRASEDYQFCHGVIGTSLPDSLADRKILQFFGRAPTYTFDKGLNEYIIRSSDDDGTGLLGHHLVGGKSTYNNGMKNGGMYATTDGTLRSTYSEAVLVRDANNQPVDLGKYISVVAAFGHVRNEYNDRTGGYLTNLANSYAGLIAALPVNQSSTAVPMNNVRLRYQLRADVADAAAGARLIVLINDDNVPTVADGPTFASHNSDFKRLTTMKIIAKVVEEVRRAMKQFYGKDGSSTQSTLSQGTAIEAIITKNINVDRTMVSGTYKISQTRAQRVNGQKVIDLRIQPIFELRQVTLNIALDAGI